MHESAHRLLFANRARQRPRRPVAARLPLVHVDRRVPPRAHGPPPSGVRARRARHPAVRGLPDQPGQLPAQAGARRRPASTGFKLFRQQFAGFRSPDARVRHTLWKILLVQAVLFGAAIVGGVWWVYPVFWVLPYLTVWRVINRLRCDRRARRDGRVERPSRHHPLRPPVVVVTHVPRAVQHRLAPRAPRRRRRVDATPARVPPGAARLRVRDTRARVPDLPRSGVPCAIDTRSGTRRGTRHRGPRVRKLRAWSSGSRTPAAW